MGHLQKFNYEQEAYMVFLGCNRKTLSSKFVVLNFMVLGLSVYFPSDKILAQIIPDRSLGRERSAVESNVDIRGVPSSLIKGGAIRGRNIFHSFESFNIGSMEGAYFSPPNNIDVILSRVTGRGKSQILGTLGVLGNADLFFLNSNGIEFGSGSALDLNGSFIASTANSANFADGTQFDSRDTQKPPLLRLGIPVGLQFGENAGSIRLLPQSSLDVKAGQTLALLGKGISIKNGSLMALSGNIELGSFSGSNEIELKPTIRGWSIGYGEVKNYSDISLSQETNIGTSDGGNIRLQGRNIDVIENSGIFSFQNSQAGGLLSIKASGSVRIIGDFSQLLNVTQGDQDAGDISISARRLVVRNGAEINTDSTGQDKPLSSLAKGSGGDILIDSLESIELADDSTISTSTLVDGDAGDVSIHTNQLLVNGSIIQAGTQGSGSSGEIDITASESTTLKDMGFIFAFTQSEGEAGSVTVDTKQLTIIGESGIVAGSFASNSGTSGDIIVEDANAVVIGNKSALSVSNSGLLSGGDIKLQTKRLILANESEISAETNSGRGGDIRLSVSDLLLLQGNENRISTTAGLVDSNGGSGGNVTIEAAVIAASPEGNNDITANAGSASGGKVSITAMQIFGLRELTFEELRALLPDDPAPTPDKLSSNDITAISLSGDPSLEGQVILSTPETDPSESTSELPERISIPPKLAQRCRAGQALGNGEFVNVGRGGLPPTPTSLRSHTASWHDIRPPAEVQQASTTPIPPQSTPVPATSPIIEAKGWVQTSKGLKLVAPEQAPSSTLLASNIC